MKNKKKVRDKIFGVITQNANGIPQAFIKDELETYF